MDQAKSVIDWTTKKVLVAGGAGMIGSHMADRLIELGATVYVADNLSIGTLNNLEHTWGNRNFYLHETPEEFTRYGVCKAATFGMNVVMNFASPAYGIEQGGKGHAEIYTESMLIGTNLLRAASRRKVELFLNVSSSCVYPENLRTLEANAGPPPEIYRGYGQAKLDLERLSQWYNEETDMKVYTVRPYNVYGPREAPELGRAIQALLRRAMNNDKGLTVWGTGHQIRNYTYVTDVVEAMLQVMDTGWTDPINIGHPEDTPMFELAKAIVDLMGCDYVDYDASKPMGPVKKKSELGLFQRLTGFEPKMSLKEGLKRTLEWMKEWDKRKL